MKLADAQHHAQSLATFCMDQPLEFTHAHIVRLQAKPEKLHKMYVAHLEWQHQQTIDTFFKSHIDFMREICIFVKTFEKINILHM